MTKLVLRRNAQRDLDEIDRFSIERFGEAVALDYIEELRRSIKRLCAYPRLGAEYPGVRPPSRHFGCGTHRIFYDYHEVSDTVIVLRVLHQAMVPERHLKR